MPRRDSNICPTFVLQCRVIESYARFYSSVLIIMWPKRIGAMHAARYSCKEKVLRYKIHSRMN